MTQSSQNIEVRHIRPNKGLVSLQLGALWSYRELIYFFVLRDLKVTYRQTILGASIAILRPVSSMILFSVIFGTFAGIPSDGIPYPVFSFSALVPWSFFMVGVNRVIGSITGNAGLINKVYFPRLVLPMAALFSGLVDFLLAFGILLGIMVYFEYYPTMNVIFLPLFFMLICITALGMGLWFAVLSVQFRDVNHFIGSFLQILMYISPIVYPLSLVPAFWQFLYMINPVTTIIMGFRWALLGTDLPDLAPASISVCLAFALLISGAYYFKYMEKTFADLV